MTIPTLPSPPLVTDTTANFNAKAFSWVAALDAWTTQANLTGAAADASASAAATSASNAATSASTASAAATSATATANVSIWVSGTTYAIGDCRFSPSTFQTFRRKTAGAGTTDPASDTTNWTPISSDLTAGPTINNQNVANTDIKNIRVATFNGEVNNATTTGAVTINWTTGAVQKQAEPTGSITYTFTAPVGPAHLQLKIDSDGTSTAQTFTWPGTVVWLGATWTAVANKKAIINFWYDGTTYFAIGTNQV